MKQVSLSQAWGQMVVFLLLLGFISKTPGLLALSGMLLVALGLAWYWNRISLHEVSYRRKFHYWRAFPGEEFETEIRIDNNKWVPLAWLRSEDRWPLAVAPRDEEIDSSHNPEEGNLKIVTVLRSFASHRKRLQLAFRRRGVHMIGPAALTSGDPFGLFTSRQEAPGRNRVVVFPELRPLEAVGPQPEDPFGLIRTTRRLFKDPAQTIGVRDYQPGDSFRRIHWPATSRMGTLQSRVYQPISGADLIVCLNVTTMDSLWQGVQPELLEDLVSTAATLVSEGMERGYRVGLISNGTISHGGQPFRIPPGRSPQHLPKMLEALAGLTPIVTSPFDRFLLAQAPKLEYGATLIVVSAVTPPALSEVLLRLRARSRRCTLVSLDETPPRSLPGIETLHWPALEAEPA